MNPQRILAAAALAAVVQSAAALPPAFDYVDFKLGAAPVIQVDGNAQGWHSASAATLKFGAQARGKCSWGYRNTFVSLTLDTNGMYNGGLLAANQLKEDGNSKAMTWSSNWKDISVDWAPSAGVRKQAVDACQAKLSERVQAGESPAAVLAAGDTASITPAQLGLHFSCDDYGLTGYKEDIFRDAPVSVQCKAVDLPPPTPVVPSAGNFKPAFQLTHVQVTADPENYKGICPKDITFTGLIRSNAAGGDISYRFLRDGVPLSAFKPLSMQVGQQSVPVHYVMTAAAQAMPPAPKGPQAIQGKGAPALPQLGIKKVPRIVLEVKSGAQQLSDEAAYSFTCESPPQLQAVPAQPGGKPDLTSQQGIQIGQAFSPWGGLLQLTAADASARSPHGCTFRMAYDVINIGSAAAAGFSSRLFDGATLLHHRDGMQLAAAADIRVSGQITLKPGSYLLRASIDDLAQVTEANEGNNLMRVSVNVGADCAEATPPRPGRADPAPRALPRPTIPGRQ